MLSHAQKLSCEASPAGVGLGLAARRATSVSVDLRASGRSMMHLCACVCERMYLGGVHLGVFVLPEDMLVCLWRWVMGLCIGVPVDICGTVPV